MIGTRFSLIMFLLAAAGCGTQVETAPTPRKQAAEDRVDGVPVTSILRLSKPAAKAGEEITLTVELQIAPLWEIHTFNAQPDSTATKLEVIAPTGISAKGPWNEPNTIRSANPSGQSVHVGKAVFQQTLAVNSNASAGTHEIVCLVSFQACNEHQCLQPQECTLKVPLVIEAQ